MKQLTPHASTAVKPHAVRRYRVVLEPPDRARLDRMIRWGRDNASKLAHARMLLLADEGPGGPAAKDDAIVAAVDVGTNTVRRVRRRFVMDGLDAALLRRPSARSRNRKLFDPAYRDAIFALLHAPPKDHGYNRTTWRRRDLHEALVRSGVQIGTNYMDRIILAAGYRFRRAKAVLTSSDPRYREKVDAILAILKGLKPTERFFSVDEFGPVAVKRHGGRRLAVPGEHPTVPQFQTSKGTLIVTAALELATNQVTHFYSTGKNTAEMIRMLDVLLEKYRHCTRLYLSWDAAGWHASEAFLAAVARVNAGAYRRARHTPVVRLAPLPARAQFLNVIESVFSGLVVSVVQNSDYASLEEARAAVDRYFADRNAHFRRHPKRAGNKIWGRERVPNAFREAQNCKNPRFR